MDLRLAYNRHREISILKTEQLSCLQSNALPLSYNTRNNLIWTTEIQQTEQKLTQSHYQSPRKEKKKKGGMKYLKK